jgi:hypothetical protein
MCSLISGRNAKQLLPALARSNQSHLTVVQQMEAEEVKEELGVEAGQME